MGLFDSAKGKLKANLAVKAHSTGNQLSDKAQLAEAKKSYD